MKERISRQPHECRLIISFRIVIARDSHISVNRNQKPCTTFSLVVICIQKKKKKPSQNRNLDAKKNRLFHAEQLLRDAKLATGYACGRFSNQHTVYNLRVLVLQLKNGALCLASLVLIAASNCCCKNILFAVLASPPKRSSDRKEVKSNFFPKLFLIQEEV